MEQSNPRIVHLLKANLDRNKSLLPFNQVWNRHKKNKQKLFKIRGAAAVVFSLLILISLGFALKPLEDKTDYPFVNDASIIGKWQSIDYVPEMDQFKPGQKSWQYKIGVPNLVFMPEGKMFFATCQGNGNLGPSSLTWTKGIVINKPEKTADQYVMKEIEGTRYMFLEWKYWNYNFLHQKPWYYVLKQVDNLDYTHYKLTTVEDQVDYPFEDDPQLIGKWECVDYVETIDQFVAGSQQWPRKINPVQLDVFRDGQLNKVMSEGETREEWTRGLLINKQNKTASKYEIKELRGDTYLFFEWKTSDYIYRGIMPGYCVLKKVE